MPPGPAGPPRTAGGHPERRCPHPVAVRRPGPPEEGREDRQAAVRRLLHHQPLGYAGLYECVKYMTGKSPHRRRGKALCPERHAAHERLLQGMEAGREHGLLLCTAPRWNPPPTSSPAACRSGSASSPASPTRTISPTATTSTCPRTLMPSPS